MKRLLLLLLLFLFASPLWAYNFLYIHPTTGKPIGWDNTKTIKYYLDPGKLGRLSNDQLHTLLKEAFKIWENASPNAKVPKFEFAGYLPEDVNGTNYQKYVNQFPCYTNDLSSCGSNAQKNLQTVIVFDEDSSILNNTFCKIGGCAAFGTTTVFSGSTQDPESFVAGTVILGTSVGAENEKISAAMGIMVSSCQ